MEIAERLHAMTDWSDEETDDPLCADDRNFYKVELWTMDQQRVLRMLYAGNNLDKAHTVFANYIRIRPRARKTTRQRTRVLDQWPPGYDAAPIHAGENGRAV
jgi:hypothetical protein